MRKTKIVATLGPASLDPQILRTMIETGVDVFRLNFSHGSRQSHRAACESIREACQDVGREVAILQDLCCQKIRCGEMEPETILATGSEVTITTRKMIGNATRFSTTYKTLPVDVRPGSPILLNDGLIELEVLAPADNEVRCKVVVGGKLKSHKGINLPGTDLSTPSVTSKDIRDLAIGVEENVDFVALSFVRHPDDIRKVRRMLDKHGCSTRIIAKIEKPEAVERIDEIMAEADGVMVARGDLGVEMPTEQVPVLQKQIIRKANIEGKFVITATQMLESMIGNPTPTRAEVSDVANAIYDGTDAVMLSGESAAGAYPLESVRMLDRIANEIEGYLAIHRPHWDWGQLDRIHPTEDAVGHAAYQIYKDLDVKAIVAYSHAGITGRFLSASRPFAPMIVFTPSHEVVRSLRLRWGVEPVYNSSIHTKKDMRYYAEEYLREHALAAGRDDVLMIAGTPFGVSDCTNSIEVIRLGAPEPTAASTPKRPASSRKKAKAKSGA